MYLKRSLKTGGAVPCFLSLIIGLAISTITLSMRADAQGLQVNYGSNGINTLSYNGATLLDCNSHPEDGFNVYGYIRTRADGSIEEKRVWDKNYTVKWDPSSNVIVTTYDWGCVRCRYTQQDNKLYMRIAVVNKTLEDTVKGVDVFPLTFRFPSMPSGWDADTPHIGFNIDGPSVEVADFGVGSVALCNEDTTQKLYSGFFTISQETAKYNKFNLWVGSTPLWYQPATYPNFSRSVGPGKTDIYVMSLRFGPSGSTAQALAPDLFGKHTHPAVKLAEKSVQSRISDASSNSVPGGLTGEYFNDPGDGSTLFTTKVLTRVDPVINFDWGTGSPDPTVHNHHFTVRWTGKILPSYSDSAYQFHVTTDDGCRLWVNDKQIIDSWGPHSPQDDMGVIDLTAGHKYNIKLEYWQSDYGASAKMEWLGTNHAREVVPTSQLFPY